MARYFSPSRGGFYQDDIHGVKGTKGSTVPRDAVAVTEEGYDALFAAQAEGQRILPSEGGAPEAGVYTPPATEVLAQLRLKRDRDLAASDWTQLNDNGLSPAQRAAWAVYRQALRDYIALVEAAIAAEQDPYGVPYPQPPQVAPPSTPPAPPAPPSQGPGFPMPDNVSS